MAPLIQMYGTEVPSSLGRLSNILAQKKDTKRQEKGLHGRLFYLFITCISKRHSSDALVGRLGTVPLARRVVPLRHHLNRPQAVYLAVTASQVEV